MKFVLLLLFLCSCSEKENFEILAAKERRPKEEKKKLPSSFDVKSWKNSGIDYRLIRTQPEKVGLLLNDQKGERLRSFSRARREAIRRFSSSPKALFNAGIFEPGETPTGLHVEGGITLHELNIESGKGNFFTKPNGVFFIEGRRALIKTTQNFLTTKKTPRLAVQSGPMLLIEGQINAKFSLDNQSHKIRNGVGICGKDIVFLFAILGDTKPNMYEFATAFKELDCSSALYLDGTISQLSLGSNDVTRQTYAGFFVVH